MQHLTVWAAHSDRLRAAARANPHHGPGAGRRARTQAGLHDDVDVVGILEHLVQLHDVLVVANARHHLRLMLPARARVRARAARARGSPSAPRLCPAACRTASQGRLPSSPQALPDNGTALSLYLRAAKFSSSCCSVRVGDSAGGLTTCAPRRHWKTLLSWVLARAPLMHSCTVQGPAPRKPCQPAARPRQNLQPRSPLGGPAPSLHTTVRAVLHSMP